MASLTMRMLHEYRVPDRSLTLWWLGQSGFIIKSPGGKIVVIDPYLSNSCKALGDQYGFDLDRLFPPPMNPAELIGVDAYALTHSHQDPLDPETLGPYRAAGGAGPYVAPPETIDKLHAMGVPETQTVMVWPNKSFAAGDLALRATFAIPFSSDDLTQVGYLVSARGGPTIYITGDTGYHEVLATSVAEHKPDVLVAVINGAFGNLSPAEAARLAKAIDPKVVIPCHHELFRDNLQPPQMLRTSLRTLGIGEKYRVVEHGQPYTFPECDGVTT